MEGTDSVKGDRGENHEGRADLDRGEGDLNPLNPLYSNFVDPEGDFK